MDTQSFVLTSRWHAATDAGAVWRLLLALEGWPGWWRYVRGVHIVSRHVDSPVGDVADIDWGSALPYGLRLRFTTISADAPRMLEGQAEGDLQGVGRWLIEPVPQDGGVRVTYRWQVTLTRPWMRRLAFLLRPVFEWNHFIVMRAGAQGMGRALNCAVTVPEEWSGERKP